MRENEGESLRNYIEDLRKCLIVRNSIFSPWFCTALESNRKECNVWKLKFRLKISSNS